ncbi:MAG: TRAP transporter small permease subunit [SAR324 cluster bacterium]|nr:TRAP transporter small permease subunit [SAR324 cluster bacterium]
MLALASGINVLNRTTGRLASYIALPLIIVVVYEVFMRYVFNAPTVWAFEATTLMYGCHFALGFGYTHQHNGHVAIDVFEAKLSERPRTILRIGVNLLFFVSTMGLMSFYGARYALASWQNWELASTSWAPPLYPFKTVLAIGFLLMFLQGIAKLIEDFKSLGGK